MQYVPDTTLRLCHVPINANQKNQIDFPNRTEQYNYFLSKTILSLDQFTYQRHDYYIRVPINAEVLYNNGINYVMYDNKNFSDRWFYAFITKIEYLNDHVSAIYLKTDVYQTWFLDCKINTCFVVRETVINDDLFKHTLPENLPNGDVKTISSELIGMDLNARTSTEFDENYYCCVFMSEYLKNVSGNPVNRDSFLGGIPNPSFIYATNLDNYFDLMNQINQNGQASGVISCVAIPKTFCKYHAININITPNPPNPPNPSNPSSSLYLGSPFSGKFHITNIYDPPNHEGIDMVSDTDDLGVYAIIGGTVVSAEWENKDDPTQGYGQRVIIEQAGVWYIYGHLDSMNVSQGDIVKAGQLIGIMGNTGLCIPPEFKHVHLQIGVANTWHGNTFNPSSETFGAKYPNEVGAY